MVEIHMPPVDSSRPVCAKQTTGVDVKQLPRVPKATLFRQSS
jgi:hypothetical protein